MCQGCYEEYGRPAPDEAARGVVPLIAAVYERCPVGGRLHIVVDDWNLDDEDIAYCLGNDIPDVDRKCGEALASLTVDQRAAALAIYNGYVQ